MTTPAEPEVEVEVAMGPRWRWDAPAEMQLPVVQGVQMPVVPTVESFYARPWPLCDRILPWTCRDPVRRFCPFCKFHWCEAHAPSQKACPECLDEENVWSEIEEIPRDERPTVEEWAYQEALWDAVREQRTQEHWEQREEYDNWRWGDEAAESEDVAEAPQD